MKKILFAICLCLLLVNVSCTNTSESVKKGTIDLTVDTKNMTVDKVDDADWYTVSVKNSSDLQYIVVTVKITNNDYLPKKCKLVVNGEEIDSKKYTIEDKTITYKMDDPNWSDFI
ncbi:MAG: hypothetical protein E7183_04995 [Erysipelotrichaceae bacterium]|nr:hypothetical protein [Erysipelotrichaceae bacterium]